MSDEKVTSETLREWAASTERHAPSGAHPHLGCMWAATLGKEIAAFLRSCADSSDSLDRMEAEQDAEQGRRAARLKLEGEQP